MKNNIFIALLIIIAFKPQTILAQQTNMETSGDILQLALPISALASTYFYQGNDKPHWQMIKAYSSTVALSFTLKYLINKERPNGGDYSFPSGHTASAFSGAAFLHLRYGWKIGIPAFLLAGYVGYTRIVANKHDKWDVLGGAIMGIGGGILFVQPYHQSISENLQTSAFINGKNTVVQYTPIMISSKKTNTSFLLNKVEGYYIVGVHYRF